MIAVQTLWTKPMSKEELFRDLPLVVLSIQSISHFYETHLVTDSIGYHLLSQITFTNNVHIYNELDTWECDIRLWSSSKYYSYQKFKDQEFIHFDTDIVLTKKITPSKNFYFDCNETLYYPHAINVIKNRVVEVFSILQLSKHIIEFSSTFNVGTLYIRDRKSKELYIEEGTRLLDLVQQSLQYTDNITKEDGGVCMLYIEQCTIHKYIESISSVEFVRDDTFFKKCSRLNSISDVMIVEFIKDRNICKEDLDIFDYHNLLKVDTTGYCHQFSFLRQNILVQQQVDFYLRKKYPNIHKQIQYIKNESNL